MSKVYSRNTLISTTGGLAMLFHAAKAETASSGNDYQIIFSQQAADTLKYGTTVVCNKETGQTYTATEITDEWPD